MQKIKKLKLIAIIAALTLCLPLALILTACGGTKKQANTNSKEMYALSAMSSAIYLQQEQEQISAVKSMKAVNLAQTLADKPANITDEDLAGTESCLTMFGDIIKNNGFTQVVEKNTNLSEELKNIKNLKKWAVIFVNDKCLANVEV